MSNGEIKYSLGMDGGQFAVGANQALELLGKIGRGAISVAEAITKEWKKLANLNDMAAALRTTASDLYTIQRGMEAATGSSAGFSSAIASLRRALSGSGDEDGQLSNIFEGMQIDPQKLMGQGPQDQILTVLEALNKLDDESKAFAARRLFGGQAQEMTMAASQIDKIKKGMEEAAATATGIDQAAASADSLLTKWGAFQQAIDETKMQIAGELLPVMQDAVGTLIDLREPYIGRGFAQEFRANLAGIAQTAWTLFNPDADPTKSPWDNLKEAYDIGYNAENDEMAANDSTPLLPKDKRNPPPGTGHINRAGPLKETRAYVDNGPGWSEARTDMGGLARIGGIMGGSGSNEAFRAIAEHTKKTASFGERTSITCEQMNERLGNMKLDFANT